MWWVRLTARSPLSGRVTEDVIRIPGSRAHDLLYNGEYKWTHLEKMMERGTLLKIEIDYKSENGWAKA